MADSALDIYNRALSAVHAKGRLTSLSTASRERTECDIWYSDVVKTVQEAAYWPGCRVLERLTLASTRNSGADWTASDPQPEFKYKYRLPDNYLRAWHLTNYDRFSLHYSVNEDEVFLSTNTENAVLVYAFLQGDVIHWTPAQVFATVHGLAANIAGPLTGRGELVQKNYQLANEFLIDAQAAALNSESVSVETVPTFLLARGYTGPVNSPRFFYPHGSLFPEAHTNV